VGEAGLEGAEHMLHVHHRVVLRQHQQGRPGVGLARDLLAHGGGAAVVLRKAIGGHVEVAQGGLLGLGGIGLAQPGAHARHPGHDPVQRHARLEGRRKKHQARDLGVVQCVFQRQVGAGGKAAQVDLGYLLRQQGCLLRHQAAPVVQVHADQVGRARAVAGQQRGAHQKALARQRLPDVGKRPGRIAQAVEQHHALARGLRRPPFHGRVARQLGVALVALEGAVLRHPVLRFAAVLGKTALAQRHHGPARRSAPRARHGGRQRQGAGPLPGGLARLQMPLHQNRYR